MKKLVLLLLLIPVLSQAQFKSDNVASQKHIPDPKVIIASDDNKGKLFEDGPMIIGEDGSSVQQFYRIVSFQIGFLNKESGMYYEYPTKGIIYTDAVRELIKTAKPGDKLFLDNIKFQGPDKKERMAGSVAYLFH